MSEPTHDADDLGKMLENELAAFFHKHEHAMLRTYLLVSEVIDPDGKAALWMLGTPGMPPWTILGYLEYMKAQELLG